MTVLSKRFSAVLAIVILLSCAGTLNEAGAPEPVVEVDETNESASPDRRSGDHSPEPSHDVSEAPDLIPSTGKTPEISSDSSPPPLVKKKKNRKPPPPRRTPGGIEETVPDRIAPETALDPVSEVVAPPAPQPPLNPLLDQDRTTASPRGIVEVSEPEISEVGRRAASESPPGRSDPEAPPDDNPPDAPVFSALAPEAPERFLDEPGEFSVTLEGQSWVFRSDLSTPGSWRYLNRERAGDSTRFHFRFDETGSWNLVFDRQDLSGGGTERRVRQVKVGEDHGPLDLAIPGKGPLYGDPGSRFDAARDAAAAGRYDEAFSLWEADAGRAGPEGARFREAIVREAAGVGATGPLVTWLGPYIEDGGDPDVLAAVLETLENKAGYDNRVISVLDALLDSDSGPRRPEWLFRLASHLEKPGELRDLDRAAELYREVVDGWPLSSWRDPAEERIIWIERHYFRIR